MTRLTQSEIQDWLRYWEAGGVVAVSRIAAFDQVHQARKFCSVMRSGLFTEDAVSDLAIWNALVAMRLEQGRNTTAPKFSVENRKNFSDDAAVSQ